MCFACLFFMCQRANVYDLFHKKDNAVLKKIRIFAPLNTLKREA